MLSDAGEIVEEFAVPPDVDGLGGWFAVGPQAPQTVIESTAAPPGATMVAVSSEPLRAVRDHLCEVVDRVERERERVTITRNGREAAVLISPDDLAGLEETLAVLSDPAALAEIREAEAAYAKGDVVRGVQAVRRLGR